MHVINKNIRPTEFRFKLEVNWIRNINVLKIQRQPSLNQYVGLRIHEKFDLMSITSILSASPPCLTKKVPLNNWNFGSLF